MVLEKENEDGLQKDQEGKIWDLPEAVHLDFVIIFSGLYRNLFLILSMYYIYIYNIF